MVREARTYCYSLPFCMIIKGNGELVLLDFNAKGNQYIANQITREDVQKCFFKRGDLYNVMFPIGKTLQYILAKTKVVPKLTGREEYKFKKVIPPITALTTPKNIRGYNHLGFFLSNCFFFSNFGRS